ncbi:hypothetical protein [Streptomyces sp. NPDC005385]|uniref:hypothetical protein n=1 Tax=Streptomyces sp. NPDC005385 TaxID=3157039 RepID=UPI0033B06E3E
MTSPRTDLSAFAAGLADRLPGTCSSEYQRHAQYADQFPRTEQLWDAGHVDYIVSQYVLTHDAVLHGPANQRLYVTDRPLYPHHFVVAPLAPDGPHIKPHHFDAVEEPNGIAVPEDPARAAAHVARRVLPRYEQALQELLDNTVAQPDPPHRPGPPQVDQVLTLTLYSDGALRAVRERAGRCPHDAVRPRIPVPPAPTSVPPAHRVRGQRSRPSHPRRCPAAHGQGHRREPTPLGNYHQRCPSAGVTEDRTNDQPHALIPLPHLESPSATLAPPCR